ncbi:MAG: glucose-1-phosphate thymidylyltransferase [Reinekea sp.]|jgi:glucose-1-phosphate thymidylyltransferase
MTDPTEGVTGWKGIVLAGGTGSRMHPLTLSTSKQLLAVYDKPMIYYPISVLMLAGIRDILVITTPADQPAFKRLLGDGRQFGIHLSYALQPSPDGLAQAFVIGEQFIGQDNVALVLGDNIFFGEHFSTRLAEAMARRTGATVFGYHVTHPERFGVVTLDDQGQALSLVEKPAVATSPYAITGLYFYDNQVVSIAKSIRPSLRGELEITDINKAYLRQKQLKVSILGRGFAWLDTGTPDAILEAGQFVQTVEQRQGLKIACLEEIAFRKGWLSQAELERAAQLLQQTAYGRYLRQVAEGYQ